MKLKKKNKKQNATRKKSERFFVLLEKNKDVFLKKVWDFERKIWGYTGVILQLLPFKSIRESCIKLVRFTYPYNAKVLIWQCQIGFLNMMQKFMQTYVKGT